MSSAILVTLTKENMTDKEIEAVVQRLKRAVPVEVSSTGYLVGSSGQVTPRVAINLVRGTMTLSIREKHGEYGLWAATAIAAVLKQSLVGNDGQEFPATVTTVSKFWGRDFSDAGLDLAEKLGVILPRVKGRSNAIRF